MKNPSFLMMGVFESEKVVGYFFLRLFLNKHSFTGYLVDYDCQTNGTSYVSYSLVYWFQDICNGQLFECQSPFGLSFD